MGVTAGAVPVRDRDDYIELGSRSGERPELVEGTACAKVGGPEAHNLVVGNLFAALHKVRGPSRMFQQGMNLRVRAQASDNSPCPDVMLCCDPSDAAPFRRERPLLLAEVLSPSKERIDLGEKLLRYQGIESLREHVVLHSARAEVFVFRKRDGWRRRAVDLDAGERLESAEMRLDFDTLYSGVPL